MQTIEHDTKSKVRDPAPNHSGVLVPPPLIYLTCFLAGVALQHYVPLPWVPTEVGRVLGPLLTIVGILLAASGVRLFWAARTSVLPVRPTTALVIEGPYRFTRNPMYVGLLLVYSGIACWLGFVWPLVLAPLLVWAIGTWVIRREERYLNRKFGRESQEYKAQVRRWL